jgi:beta-alanine--pyruvate transaminase
MIELFHGYTYSGHPVACAAGLATLDIYESGGLLTRAAELAPYWEEKVHSLREMPNIKDIRNLGLIGGVELESREGEFGTRAYEVFLKCYKAGAMVRYTGETIAMSPPLIFEKENIDTLIGILGDAIKSTA